ncbi:MAG: hypothetical protein U0324_07390 [Polyangiales bacterium]
MSDAAPDQQAPGPPRTFDYVISRVTIEGPVGVVPNPLIHNQGVSGFNLDGRFSGPMGARPGDCAHGDLFSTLDPDQNMGTCAAGMARGGASCNGGVDNQFPELTAVVGGFGIDLRLAFDEQPSQGGLAMLARISNVNGTPGPTFNDPSVNVSVFAVGRPMFASCGARNVPGQAYAIDTMSPDATFTGRIANGRVIVDPPELTGVPNFTLPLPIRNADIALRLFQTQIRVSVTPDGGTGGNLGGYIPLADLTPTLAPLFPSGISPSVVRQVLSSLVDIQYPMGNAMGCTDPNGAVGIGLGFTLVRASIQPARVSGPQPGMCGS